MSFSKILRGSITFVFILMPMTSAQAMCTGVVVNAPVTLYGGEKAKSYKQGEVVWYITQYFLKDANLYLCSWGGDCVSGDDVHLKKRLKVHGNTDDMSGAEVKENSYESNENCTLRDLELREP